MRVGDPAGSGFVGLPRRLGAGYPPRRVGTRLELSAALTAAHAAHANLSGGALASYIPELAEADPATFALAACPLDSEPVVAGAAEHAFTLQSLSKPFAHAIALDRLGPDVVHSRVGVEPTGDPFDSIVRLESESHLPHNPMVNAGAVAVTGLLLENGVRFEELLSLLGACAGREALKIDVPVWLSERETAHRNRAIAYLLRHFGALSAPVEETLDLYFRQCSALVTTRELAVMAGTLAGYGVCPVTGERVLSVDAVERTLAVMSTCGLYDATGRFLFEVGLPAKSGVSGGLVAVAPGRLGIAGFSPPLDAEGNSVRARAAVADVSDRLALHALEPGPSPAREDATKSALTAALEHALAAAADTGDGRVADYAPALAAAERARLGLALCTVDGIEAEAGDSRVPFSLQAVCNPLAYARARDALGREPLARVAGVEPSGNPFHAILFDPRSERPYNPLGNAGAIAVASLAPGRSATERLRGMLSFLSSAADGAVAADATMLHAEERAGDRNRAIAALLRGSGVIEDEESALQLYWQHCSITANAVQLARIGATLAAGGVSPVSRTRLLSPDAVRDTLSLMYTCGQHTGSGLFAYEVGIPAKSGISGGLLAVVPRRMSIVAWSPAVDSHGTSVRGRAAVQALSRELGLAVFAASANAAV